MTEPFSPIDDYVEMTRARDRSKLALSVISQRGHSRETCAVVEDILRGRTLRELVDERRAELDQARQRGLGYRLASRLRNRAEGGVA